jgi:hypothetical protein
MRQPPLFRILVAIAAVIGASVAVIAAVTTASAADPASPAGMSTMATIAGSSQSGVANGSSLSALQDGTTVSIVMQASGASAGKFMGADVRLCRGGATITSPTDFDPTQGGNCIDQPFDAQSDALQTQSAAPNDVAATITFRVGEGTRTFTTTGGSSTITCGPSAPCALWIKESFDPSLVASGSLFLHYDLAYAGPPDAPSVAATGGTSAATVTWTPPVNTGNAPITSYTVSVTPPDAAPQTVSGSATSATFAGLTNFSTYTAGVTAMNTAVDGTTHFASPVATAAFTPSPSPPNNLGVAPGDGSARLSWTIPAGPAPTDNEVTVTPTNPSGPDIVRITGASAPPFDVTGLTNGTVYTFKVRAKYGTNFGPTSASSPPFVPGVPSQQAITAIRPVGDLVLTQICGNHAARFANALYPGSPAIPASTSGTAPSFNGTPDPLFGQYPYPTDASGNPTANYPTDCGLGLGTATFLTKGPGAGQFFRADGILNQITIEDTRDTDPGWTVDGTMGQFTSGGGKAFGGNQLGWKPLLTTETPPATDGSGNTYMMNALQGQVVAPNAVTSAGGMSGGAELGAAPPSTTIGTTTTGGLGIAQFDADVHLLIPVFAKSGTYSGVLTITAI